LSVLSGGDAAARLSALACCLLLRPVVRLLSVKRYKTN